MTATTELLEDLAVPYVLVMSSVESDGGNWLRRAEYPELPGCVAESTNALEALREVDVLRIRMILEMRQRGERPPRPRLPLTSGLATIGVDDVDAFLAEIFHESRP